MLNVYGTHNKKQNKAVVAQAVFIFIAALALAAFKPANTSLTDTYQHIFSDDLYKNLKKEKSSFAESIDNADLVINLKQRTVTLTLEMHEGGKIKAEVLQGQINHKRTGVFTETGGLSGEFTCVDLARNQCETLTIQLKRGANTANMIYRNRVAELNVTFPQKNSGTESYKKVEALFKNTEQGVKEGNSLKRVRVETLEVVGGRSWFEAYMMSFENELIAFRAPLLKNAEIARELSLTDKTEPMLKISGFFGESNLKTQLQQKIDRAHILKSSDQGEIEVQMVILEGNTQDTLKISMKQVVKPVITAESI